VEELHTRNINDTLKALSTTFEKIGWDKQLGHLTKEEALAIISAINSVSVSKEHGIIDLNNNESIPDVDEIPF
jgi:hypothetical protein